MKLTRPITGWILYDFANSAFATTVLAVIFNQYFALVVAGGESGSDWNIPLIGTVNIPGASMWSLVVAISTGLVALSAPLFGAMADRGMLRKAFLFFYCYLGVLGTLGLYFVNEGDILLGGLLFMIANFGFAGGNVFYNSFLVDITEVKHYGRVSGTAWGIGYLGGGLCLVLNLIMLKYPHLIGFAEGSFGVQECFLVAGLWWGIFAIPTMIWVKEKKTERIIEPITVLFKASWLNVLSTFRKIKEYKQLVRFLFAYLCFNDGIETVIIMASIYGAQEVGMQAGELVLFFIMVQATGFVGAMFFGYLADKLSNKLVLMITLHVWLIVVVWAFFLGIYWDVKTEYYIIGVLAGIVMGGSQSIARALQASFTPNEHSAQFFGFFAISGKFASVFGPLFFGAMIMLFQDIRIAILSIGLFFVIGILILRVVDEKEGVSVAHKEFSS